MRHFDRKAYDQLLSIITTKAKEEDREVFEESMDEIVRFFSAYCSDYVRKRKKEIDTEPVIRAIESLTQLANKYGTRELYIWRSKTRSDIEAFVLEVGLSLYAGQM